MILEALIRFAPLCVLAYTTWLIQARTTARIRRLESDIEAMRRRLDGQAPQLRLRGDVAAERRAELPVARARFRSEAR